MEKRGRKNEIVDQYLALLDGHLSALRSGQAERTLEINDFARQLHVHPGHLSNTINEVLNCSPCNLYEERLLAVAQDMLINDSSSIADIARTLFYDPSNFSKFFKTYTGITPGQFRKQHIAKN